MVNKSLENPEPAYTFDDVLLEPAYSEVKPIETDVSSQLTKNIKLNVPIVSSPMDTVTEHELAICVAENGGFGVIHKNNTKEVQAWEVRKVKRKFNINGMVESPECVKSSDTIESIIARKEQEKYKFDDFPVIDTDGRLVGILKKDDFRSCDDPTQTAESIMTPRPLTAPYPTDIENARKLMRDARIRVLPLVDSDKRLVKLYTSRDIEKVSKEAERYCLDSKGRLRVGAAIGVVEKDEPTDKMIQRLELLVAENVDVIVIDSAHGHSKGILQTLYIVKKRFPNIDVIAGNVATYDGAKSLCDLGADAIKAGVGPGSICTTRVISGAGVPQITAIHNSVKGAQGYGVPVISDGGIRYSGDITKAMVAGADTVMIGGLFAGTEESPGEEILFQGRIFRVYRGMGSQEAMEENPDSRDRYGQKGNGKLVPEGVSGRVPLKGSLSTLIYQLVGGLRAGMGYCGAHNIKELKNAKFILQTANGVRESHPHDIGITSEPPNYQTMG